MQENQDNKYGEAKIKSPFLEKVENFFYHYKWHTLIALFLVFTVTICSVQMCQKVSYDAHILYAGGSNITTSVAEGEEESKYATLHSAIKKFVADRDGDGERNLSVLNLFIPSPDELAKMENSEYFTQMVVENNSTLKEYLYYGEYYICILSDRLLSEYTKDKDTNPFAKIAGYLPEGAKIADEESAEGYRLASEYGVYLKSTPLADNAGFSLLGEDTVICIRKYSRFGTSSSKEKSMEYYEFCESTLRLMLADKSYQ